MTHTLELQLRMLIRENLLESVSSEPLDINSLRSLVREQVRELVQEASTSGSFWSDFDWAKLFSDLEDAITVIGLVAGGALIIAGGAASAPFIAGICTAAAVATVVISVGQAVDKLLDGDIYGFFFEVLDCIFAIVGLKYLPPTVTAPLKTKILSLVYDFVTGAVGKMNEYIDKSLLDAEKKKKIKEAVKVGAAAAKTAAQASGGSSVKSSSATLSDLESRAIEIAIDDSDNESPPLSEGDLLTEIEASFNNIDPRAITPLSSHLHTVYLNAYVTPGDASAPGSTTKPKRTRAPSRTRKTTSEVTPDPTTYIRNYKYDTQNGDLRWTGEEAYMGKVVGNLYDMKPGDRIPPTGRITLVRVDIDPIGTRITNVIVKGPTGELLKVRSMSQ